MNLNLYIGHVALTKRFISHTKIFTVFSALTIKHGEIRVEKMVMTRCINAVRFCIITVLYSDTSFDFIS